MKRSIISFCIFAGLVLTGACLEVWYSNIFVKDTLEITQAVEQGENSEKYLQYLESRKILNKLFFKRSTVEKLEKEFCEMSAYEHGSRDFNACIERIELYCRHLKNAGMF